MNSPSRVLGVAASIAALTLSACASMTVGSYADRRTDVTRYRTYDWAPAERFSTGDPRLDNNPFFQDALRGSVEAALGARGFEKRAGAPDLLVHYHASVHERIDVGRVDEEYGYQIDEAERPFVYEAGTLWLDLVDARTNRLVWRGWAESAIDGVIDDQALMEKKIDEAVRRIVQRMPRRLQASR